MYVKPRNKLKKGKRRLSPSQVENKQILENWVYMTKSVQKDHKPTLERIRHYAHHDSSGGTHNHTSDTKAHNEYIDQRQELMIKENNLILAKYSIEEKYDKRKLFISKIYLIRK